MYVHGGLNCFTFGGVDCTLILSVILLLGPSRALYSPAKSLTCLTLCCRDQP